MRFPEPRIAVVTPSLARDFTLCCELNDSVQRYLPEATKHYLIVDRKDLELFRTRESARTIVMAVEDIIPAGYVKLPYLKKWWFAGPAFVPAKGWLIQQLAKISAAAIVDADVQVNVDSDVRFVRPVDASLFVRDGKTRLYRKPRGIHAGMPHVKWHKNVCRLLGIAPDELPMDDYVGNMISWNPRLVARVLAHVEAVTGVPWHVAFTRGRMVAEYLLYGLYAERIAGPDAAGVWIDERSWCHTYWGPEPLQPSQVQPFVDSIPLDDVAFSVAGYTDTQRDVVQRATRLVLDRVAQT